MSERWAICVTCMLEATVLGDAVLRNRLGKFCASKDLSFHFGHELF